MSSLYSQREDYEAALYWAWKAVKVLGPTKGTPFYDGNMAICQMMLGMMLMRAGRYQEGKIQLRRSHLIVRPQETWSQLQTIANLLAKAYSLEGNSDSTITWVDSLQYFAHMFNNQAITDAIGAAEVEFETEKTEAALATSEAEKAQAQELADAQQRLLWAIGIGLFVALLLAALALRAFLQKRKANDTLHAQREEISAQNEEKALLLKEIHHRVKNNLQVISSLLQLQSKEIEDPKALSAMSQGQNRVKAIALIHQKLYQTENLARLNFREYLEQLTTQAVGLFPADNKPAVHISVADMPLDVDTAVPLGLIANELITNACKYAFAGNEAPELTITANALGDGKYRLAIQDNGPGLPADFAPEKAKSLGLRLVHRLTDQLFGEVEFDSASGTKVSVTFLDTEARKAED